MLVSDLTSLWPLVSVFLDSGDRELKGRHDAHVPGLQHSTALKMNSNVFIQAG